MIVQWSESAPYEGIKIKEQSSPSDSLHMVGIKVVQKCNKNVECTCHRCWHQQQCNEDRSWGTSCWILGCILKACSGWHASTGHGHLSGWRTCACCKGSSHSCLGQSQVWQHLWRWWKAHFLWVLLCLWYDRITRRVWKWQWWFYQREIWHWFKDEMPITWENSLHVVNHETGTSFG